MLDKNNSEMKITEMLTRNIAKSGEMLNWSGFSPFHLHLGLIMRSSQSASCHIAIVRVEVLQNYKS